MSNIAQARSAGARSLLLERLANALRSVERSRVLRVAIDGVDGAGKTMFADELAQLLREEGAAVIRASIDGFHNPRAVRYARGKESPEGFFRDSYDYKALKRLLLDPIAPGGDRMIRTAAFDHRNDTPVDSPLIEAIPGSILLFDGIFLHRPELRDCWDYSIFLDVPFDISVARCAAREGSSPDPEAESNRRYVDGQKLYFAECAPWRYATTVIDYTDLDHPVAMTWRG